MVGRSGFDQRTREREARDCHRSWRDRKGANSRRGIGIGNGGDDFEWMDSWQVYSKTPAAHAVV